MPFVEQREDYTTVCSPEECHHIAKAAHNSFVILTNEEAVKQRARRFHALGNEVRLRILGLLALQEMCTCNIVTALDGASSTITHHLRILENGGLINSRREGKFTIYRLNEDFLKQHRIFDEANSPEAQPTESG